MKMITKIAIAIDDSTSAIHAVNYAIALASQINAKIEIISIIKFSIGNIDAGILPQEIESKNINELPRGRAVEVSNRNSLFISTQSVGELNPKND